MKESGKDLSRIVARFSPAFISETIHLLQQGTITRTSAKEVFEASFREGRSPAAIVAERGIAVIGAGDALTEIAQAVIAEHTKVVDDYRSGKVSAIKFLVGQVMKRTKGQANPQAAQEALERIIG